MENQKSINNLQAKLDSRDFSNNFKDKEEFEKFYKDLSEHNKSLLSEIEELELQVLEMLELCFILIGLKEEFIEEALQYYAKLLEMQSDEEYTKEGIKRLVLQVKKEKSAWFH